MLKAGSKKFQRILISGCSGVTYLYVMKQDFFGLRILLENSFQLPFYF